MLTTNRATRCNHTRLLEPYIFFNRADKEIVQDYDAYRRANRDKLHRYWAEFVVHGTP
ncbi:MAG TPA: hypothetical protein VE821_05230 [Pyrinomonadaceae bacterium]|nr:hypothetical protein [Pyrinomonadaceae bacterium]